MTPQEKAKQLVYKFQDEGSIYYFEKNKQFALIVVDEILDELDHIPASNETRDYWEEVKQEIEKL